MTEITSKANSTRPNSSWIGRIVFALLGLLLLSIVLVYTVLFFGSVNGEEFSADSFRRRRFAYLEFPLIGFQITPIRHTDTTNDLEKYLSGKSLLPKPAEPQNRWDLVTAEQGVRGGIQGDARILCQYLDAVDNDGDSIWLKWTKDHTEEAKVLWPAVAEVARQELYSFIPELFVVARSATTPDQLKKDLDESLADKYLVTAETLDELDQKDAAAELFAEVLRYAPDRADIVDGRDKSAKNDNTKSVDETRAASES